MNKYEQRAARDRRATAQFSKMLWTATLALIVVALLILGLSNSAGPSFYSRGAIALAIVLLIIRQLSRRSRAKGPRAAQPDPRSRLNLD
jgi:predicted anti-sigma-YlaC factor YlaD